MRSALTLLAGVAVLAVTGCGGSGGAPPAAQQGAERVRDVSTVDSIKADFEADAGRPRLLLILSPT